MAAASLIFELHGELLRALSHASGKHYAGLTVAACSLRQQLGPRLVKKLKQVDTTFSVLRHITDVYKASLIEEVMMAVTSTAQVDQSPSTAPVVLETECCSGIVPAFDVASDLAASEPLLAQSQLLGDKLPEDHASDSAMDAAMADEALYQDLTSMYMGQMRHILDIINQHPEIVDTAMPLYERCLHRFHTVLRLQVPAQRKLTLMKQLHDKRYDLNSDETSLVSMIAMRLTTSNDAYDRAMQQWTRREVRKDEAVFDDQVHKPGSAKPRSRKRSRLNTTKMLNVPYFGKAARRTALGCKPSRLRRSRLSV